MKVLEPLTKDGLLHWKDSFFCKVKLSAKGNVFDGGSAATVKDFYLMNMNTTRIWNHSVVLKSFQNIWSELCRNLKVKLNIEQLSEEFEKKKGCIASPFTCVNYTIAPDCSTICRVQNTKTITLSDRTFIVCNSFLGLETYTKKQISIGIDDEACIPHYRAQYTGVPFSF